jgi:hypothetical protein
MRTIEWTSAFKRDYKRVKATPRHAEIEALLDESAICWRKTSRSRKSATTMA